MTIGANPKLSEVVSDFGSDGTPSLADYVRGGARVPNVTAYNAVATSAASLKLSQFASLTGPIKVNSDWGSQSGANPQTSATRTLTVPGGTGTLRIDRTSTVGTPTFTYSKNGGAFTTVTNPTMTLSVANGDTIAFRCTGSGFAGGTLTIYDNANNAQVGFWETNV